MKSRADLMFIEGFHNLEMDTDRNPCVWENHYVDDQGVAWTDVWSCQCESDGYEPVNSVWIGPESEVLKALWEALPENGTEDPSPVANRSRRPSLTLQEIAAIYAVLQASESHVDSDLACKFADLIREELNPVHRAMTDAYRAAAPITDGEMEVDNDAEISLGVDAGAYVMTWVWVPAENAGFMPEKDEEIELDD